jgi:hypothetical protein
MPARDELLALYGQWFQLTEQEGEAIRGALWPQVELCQGAKERLMARIAGAGERLTQEARSAGLEMDRAQAPMRPIVDELIRMETRNGEWLERQMEVGRKQREALDQTMRNLRQVKRAYAGQAAAQWQSYS